MAVFNYEVSYKGNRLAPNLSDAVIKAIDNLVDSQDLLLRPLVHREFKKAYRNLSLENYSSFGLQTFPGIVAGTEQVSIQFSGREEQIISLKKTLLEKVEGLELE